MKKRLSVFYRPYVLVLVLSAFSGFFLQSLDELLHSVFYKVRGFQQSHPDIVIVDIDQDSTNLDNILDKKDIAESPLLSRFRSWPWPRALQAELAQQVLEAGADRVVFQILYPTVSSYGESDDRLFSDIVGKYSDKITLLAGIAVHEQRDVGLELVRINQPIYKFAKSGIDALLLDSRGMLSRLPGKHWISENTSADANDETIPLAYAVANKQTPNGEIGINYAGPSGTIPVVPAWRIEEKPKDFWKKKIVIIGRTPSVLSDQKQTPFGLLTSVEIQASAISTIMLGNGFSALPNSLVYICIVAWISIYAYLLSLQSSSMKIAALAGLATIIITCGLFILWIIGWYAPIAPFMLPTLLGGITLFGKQWLEELNRERYFRSLLEKRISASLLNDLLREPGPLSEHLFGQRVRCALLFSDLFDFTPLTEELGTAEIFRLLNRYFEAISCAVIEENGFLDKYIGDSLMAEFGVPKSRGDAVEAMAAVKAAIAMCSKLDELNKDLINSGHKPLKHGIGIHFGEVMAGNLGGSKRMEYTVVGDSVNIANRLERLTRTHQTSPIVISSSILDLLPGILQVIPLGPQKLRGVQDPIESFSVIGINIVSPN